METARAACPDIDYSVQHLPELDYADRSFQLVICSEVLEHVAEPKASLLELRRVMADDGYLVVTMPNGDRFGLEQYLRPRHAFQPADDFFYTYAEAQHLFRRAGLRICDYAGWDGFVQVDKNRPWLHRRWLRLLNLLLRLHPDAPRRQKRILYILRKDDYLLHHDF